jgi:hypothetical protein
MPSGSVLNWCRRIYSNSCARKPAWKLKTRNCGAWWAGSRWPGLSIMDVGENRASRSRGRRPPKRPNNLEPGNLIPGVGSAPKPHKALKALRGNYHLPMQPLTSTPRRRDLRRFQNRLENADLPPGTALPVPPQKHLRSKISHNRVPILPDLWWRSPWKIEECTEPT